MAKTNDKLNIKEPNSSSALALDPLKELCERMPAMVAVYNIHTGQYLYVNIAVQKLLGYNPEDFIKGGTEFAVSLIHPDDLPKIMSKNDVALENANKQKHRDIASEPIASFDYRMRHKKGHWVWLHTDGSIFSRTDGKVECVLNISLDISNHKQTEERLTKTNTKIETAERFVLSQQAARVGTFELRSDNKRVTLSPELESLYGLDRGSFKGSYEQWLNYIHLEDRAKVNKAVQNTLKGGGPFNLEFRINKSGGRSCWMLGRGELTKRGKAKFRLLIGVNVDINDRRNVEENLKKNEELLNLALSASGIGIWEWDIAGDELNWSDRLKKIYGLKPKDNVTYERYSAMLHPEDASHMQLVIKNALKSGQRYQVEHRIVWLDGSVHWVLGHGRAFMINNKPVRMIGTSINIDERKLAEELRIKMAALTSEREELVEINKTKDEFVAITSHQLRTPATGIKQYLGLLLEGYADPLSNTQKTFIEKAYANNERQLHLIEEFLRIAQVDLNKIRLKYELTDIRKLIKESVEALAEIFASRGQKVTLPQAQENLQALIDKNQMHLVIENLLENASNYSPEGTKITIRLHRPSKSTLRIEIADRGFGINKADFPKLFQKFSRLENPLSNSVSGTGLGLYFSKKIVELHNGTIEVKSSVNKGTSFIISLPV